MARTGGVYWKGMRVGSADELFESAVVVAMDGVV